MPPKSRRFVPAALGLTLMVGTWGNAQEPKDLPPGLPAQQPKGVGEAIGEKVDNVVQSLKRGARATTESLQEQYQQARTSVHNMGVQTRVYSRLHWDKNVGDARIDIEFKDGTAILRGAVKSLQAKARARDLARDTIGVDRVDDQLTIESVSPADAPERSEKIKP